MSDKVKGTVAVVLIIIAAILIARNLKKDNLEEALVVGCTSCNELYTTEVILYEAPFPLECKYCGENSVYRMLECQDCGTAYHLIPGSSGQCTGCGSANVKQLKEIPK